MKVLYVVEVYSMLEQFNEMTQIYLMARHAFHSIAELSLEIVDDNAVVRHSIEIPFLFASNLRRQNF